MAELIEEIIRQAENTSFLELTAVVFGLLSVWFSLRENILVYPTGIVSVLIYVYITFQYRLYGDMGINAYYFLMSVFGWYNWTNTGNKDQAQIPITTLTSRGWVITISLFVSFFFLLSFGLSYTDSDVPFWDASTTALALLGMWLMAKKKIENWIAWVLCDISSVPLYFYKGLPYTSLQFLIFTILATWGYFSWRKKYLATL